MGEHERYLAIALEEARLGLSRGEQPFGACVVRDGEVISRAHSMKVSTADATAHAETRAVGLATRALGTRDLQGCSFYSVCEPCPMCCGAILGTGINTLVLGARLANLRGRPGSYLGRADKSAFDLHQYSVEGLAQLTGSGIQIVSGVLERECEDLYRAPDVAITR